MGYCSKCGKAIAATAVLCSECKSKLTQKEDYMDSLLKSMNQNSTVRHLNLKPKKKTEVLLEEEPENELSEELDKKPIVESETDVENETVEAMVEESEETPIETLETVPIEESVKDPVLESVVDTDMSSDVIEDTNDVPANTNGSVVEAGISDEQIYESDDLVARLSAGMTPEQIEAMSIMPEIPDDFNIQNISEDSENYIYNNDNDEAVDELMRLNKEDIDMEGLQVDGINDIISGNNDPDNQSVEDMVAELDSIDDINDIVSKDMIPEGLSPEDIFPSVTQSGETLTGDDLDNEEMIIGEPYNDEMVNGEAESSELSVDETVSDISKSDENESTKANGEETVKEESVDENSMADNLDNEIDNNINTESNDLMPHDEGDALEELFARSEDNNEVDELSDIDMSEFNLDDILQNSDNVELPSLDELMMADGSDEIDELLGNVNEEHSSESNINQENEYSSESDINQEIEPSSESDINQGIEPGSESDISEGIESSINDGPEDDIDVKAESILNQEPENEPELKAENLDSDDLNFSLDDLMLDDSGSSGMPEGDYDKSDDDIDLMGLLTGGNDSLELIDGHSPEEDKYQVMNDDDSRSGSEDEEINDMQNFSSGNSQVLIDNDILSIDNLDEPSGSMGDVFSDALSALSSEQDKEEADDVSALLDNSKLGKKKKKTSKKSQKKGRINGLFGNIVDEKEIAKAQEEKKAAEQAEKQQEVNEEKQKELAAEKEKKKAEAKEAKARAKEEKIQKKLAKKQAKKDEKELRELEEEAEIEGRINKVGAAIVFVVLLLMAAFIFIGTKLFSYSNSISNAENYLEKGQYEESYNELLGVELKEEDKVLYQKVVTIMYVYKQLEAYDVYYKESRYPEALDSLLKGIREYEKYMPDAIELDVSSDFDSVKNQIVTELVAEYGITEEMAKEINQITDSAEYSQRVYDLSQNLASNHY